MDKGLDLTQKNPVDGSMLAHTILFNLCTFADYSDAVKEISKKNILNKIFSSLDENGIFDNKKSTQDFYDKVYQTSIINSLPQTKFNGTDIDIDLIFKKKSFDGYILKDIFNSHLSLEN